METKDPPAVLFLVGEEDFRREEELDRRRKQIFGSRTPDLDYSVFYGSQSNAREILESARTLPFLSGRRLVVVREADELPEADRELLAAYCRKPVKTSCLVLDLRDPAGAAAFSSVFKSPGVECVECRPPSAGEMSDWIVKRARQAGKKIAADAAAVILERCGRDLPAAAGAIENLALYAGERELITRQDAEALIPRSAESETFDLLRQIENGRTVAALAVLQNLFREGKEESEILGLLGWQLRRLKRAKELLAAGASPEEMTRELNLKSRSLLDLVLRQARSPRFSDPEGKLAWLLETDAAIKSGRVKPQFGLELLTIRLCRDRSRPGTRGT